MTNSFADELLATQLMLAGLKANADLMIKRGIDTAFLTALEKVYQDATTLGNEQEALKARLKEKTAALNESVAAMQKKRGEARKLVKIELPRESWKEFGIETSR